MIPLVVPVVLGVARQFRNAVDLSGLEGSDVTGVGWTGYTVVTRLRKPVNLLGGTHVRVLLRAPSTASVTLATAYIGRAATSGNAWSFASSPTQLTFNGSASVTIPAKRRAVSDSVAFEFNPAYTHCVAFDVSSGTLRAFFDPEGPKNVISYFKAATSEAGTTTKGSGYTAQGDTAYTVEIIRAAKLED